MSHPEESHLPRVLAVDSFQDWHSITRNVLKENGVQLIHANSVKEATTLLDLDNFNLVISGIKMPDGSGLDIMRLAEAKEIPFIICTSYEKDALPDVRYRQCPYVWKGEIKKLSAMVERLLGSSA